LTIKNEEILEELKVEPVDEKLRQYKFNWLRHVKKRTATGCQKVLIFRPSGRRREAETGPLKPN
jgi:hypothetical protein